MQNNILLPNSNVAPLTGMSRSEDRRPNIPHDIPENDPHFLDSAWKKGFAKLGQRFGLATKPRRTSTSHVFVDERSGKEQEKTRRASTAASQRYLSEREKEEDSQPNMPMSQQAIRKDHEDAQYRRASMAG